MFFMPKAQNSQKYQDILNRRIEFLSHRNLGYTGHKYLIYGHMEYVFMKAFLRLISYGILRRNVHVVDLQVYLTLTVKCTFI